MSDQPSVSNPAFPVDRKIYVSQIAMLATVATFIIATLVSRLWGVELPAEVQTAIMGLLVSAIGGVTGWMTRSARSDIVSKMTNSMVVEANNDKASPVNLAQIVVMPTAAPDTVVAREKV